MSNHSRKKKRKNMGKGVLGPLADLMNADNLTLQILFMSVLLKWS